MEITTISVDETRRDALAEFRDQRDHPNLDAALEDALARVRGENETRD